MNPGKLDKYLTFQSKVIPETKNSFGSAQEVFADAFDAWAALQRPGSREFPTFLKRYAESTARFVVHYDRRLMVPNASDLYQIVLVLDTQSSPIITQTWDISPPYLDADESFLIVEASEIR